MDAAADASARTDNVVPILISVTRTSQTIFHNSCKNGSSWNLILEKNSHFSLTLYDISYKFDLLYGNKFFLLPGEFKDNAELLKSFYITVHIILISVCVYNS